MDWKPGRLATEKIGRSNSAEIGKLLDDLLEDHKRTKAHPREPRYVRLLTASDNRSTIRGQIERELIARNIGGLRPSVKLLGSDGQWALFLVDDVPSDDISAPTIALTGTQMDASIKAMSAEQQQKLAERLNQTFAEFLLGHQK